MRSDVPVLVLLDSEWGIDEHKALAWGTSLYRLYVRFLSTIHRSASSTLGFPSTPVCTCIFSPLLFLKLEFTGYGTRLCGWLACTPVPRPRGYAASQGACCCGANSRHI
jgi:hypothetical protein